MSSISKSNNSYSLLAGNATFTGLIEKLPLNDISITVALTIDQPVSVVINQYRNSSETSKVSEIIQAVSIGDTGLVQVPIIGLWANISVTNTSPTNMTSTSITTFFQTTNYANINIRDLTDTRDKINMMGLSPTNTQIQIALDADGRLITSGGGGGDASLWSEFPALQNVDMNNNGLTSVNSIGGLATKGLPILADGILNLTSNSAVVLSSKVEVAFVIPPEPSPIIPPLPTKTLTYDVNGDLTFAEGTQNLSNELGITTSKSFTLTQGGGGVITFEDGTTMATAGGGGGEGNFSTPSTVDLDMDSHKIINITELGAVAGQNIDINSGITFNAVGGSYINNVSNIVGNNVGGDPYLEISNLTSIYTPSGTELQINVVGGVSFVSGTNLLMGEGGINGVSSLGFTDSTSQTTAYQNPFESQLDMNGQSIIRTQQIFGNNDMLFTAGMTNTSEDSTLSLTNNGYAVAGKYSQIFLTPDGVQLNTGDITAVTDYRAILDTDGVFTAPSLSVATGGGGSLKMNGNNIRDVNTILSSDNTSIAITTNQSGSIILRTNTGEITEKTASLATTGEFTAPSFTLQSGGGGSIVFSDSTVQTTAFTSSSGITSNTFYVNDNVNNINDVIGLMGSGNIAIVSAGSFGQATDITWNVAQTGLSGSVAPAPLSFLTTANASRFTVTATQVRVANIKFQLPVFLSGNNCQLDNCDFDDNLTVGTNVSGYITITNCEFAGTKTITVASTFANVCYFINCNFLGSTFVLSQASASQVIFNNCAGFTTYPANATYVGINVLSAGSAQLSTNDIKSVSGTLRLTSGLNVNGQTFTNVADVFGNLGTDLGISSAGDTYAYLSSNNTETDVTKNISTVTCYNTGITLDIQTGDKETQLAIATLDVNGLFTVPYAKINSGLDMNAGSITKCNYVKADNNLNLYAGETNTTAQVVITNCANPPDFTPYSLINLASDGIYITPADDVDNAHSSIFKQNGNLELYSNLKVGGGGSITFADATVQSSGVQKGTGTLVAGSYTITDARVTTGAICVATYADSSPLNAVLCAKVTAGQIVIESTLLADVSPIFFMYFI